MQIVGDDLPGPEELLDQFSGTVVAQIANRSTVGFDNAMREMTDYHRLLLNLFSTQHITGDPGSYAEFVSGWEPLHRSWLSPYTPVIQRAVEAIGDTPDYFRNVSYLPYTLLSVEADLPADMTSAIMALGPRIAYALEGWFTKRAALAGSERLADKGASLIGSDRAAYDEAVRHFVGAWEAIRRTGPSSNRHMDPHTAWSAEKLAWSLTTIHLENTARCFVIAAWNRDEVGTEHYADMLVRWGDRWEGSASSYAFKEPWLLTSDIISMPWEEAKSAVAPRLYPYALDELTPGDVASQVIGNLHKQVLMISAAITLNWALTGKGGRFAIESARRLLEPPRPDDDFETGRSQSLDFGERLRTLVAISLAGPRYADQGHGHFLDRLARSLDGISEKPVISGRVYSPSTAHDRTGLRQALHLLLLASIRKGAIVSGTKLLTGLVKEDAGPNGPSTLTDVESFLQELESTVQNMDNQNQEVVSLLAPSIRGEYYGTEAVEMIERSLREVRDFKAERLLRQQVSLERIGMLETAINTELTTGNGRIPVFSHFDRRFERNETIFVESHTITGLPKNEFLDPPLETQSSNFMEVVGRECADLIVRRMWQGFFNLPKKSISLKSTPSDLRFWRTLSKRAQKLGGGPILMLSSPAYREFAGEFLYGEMSRRNRLEIERQTPPDRGTYRQTVEGMDVHEVNFAQRGEAYLVPPDLLQAVTYQRMKNGLVVQAEFKSTKKDPSKGAALLNFGIHVDWKAAETQHFHW